MKKSIAILAAALAASPSIASDWVRIGTATDGTVAYIDAETAKLVGKGVWRVWAKTDTGTSIKFKSMNVTHFVRQLTLNCTDETILLGSGVVYLTDGTNKSLTPDLTPDAAVPDTTGATIIDVMCRQVPALIEKR